MNEDLFYERLVKLRVNKGVSQREMSLSLGQSEGYMTKIESRAAFPSMTVFFYICEYFGIHPKDFFDEEERFPEILNKITIDLNKMTEKQLINIAAVIKDVVSNSSK